MARALAATGVRPNTVSLASIVFAIGAAIGFYASAGSAPATRAALLFAAAACIQLRLLANLLDGMLAVEEGLKSKTGDIFNELPDRIADVMILAGAGYAVEQDSYGVPLGWAAAVLALFTAYVRVLAGSLGLTQHFIGPMAKQHRMFVLTIATLVATVESLTSASTYALPVGLATIALGSLGTAARRTRRLLREARAR